MKKWLLPIFVLLASLSSCNNDEDVMSINPNDAEYMIVGRWYLQDDVRGMFAEYTFTADGAIYIDEYSMMKGYKRVKKYGTYSIEDNNISAYLNTEGSLPVQEINEITDYNVLTLKTHSRDYHDCNFCRIIQNVSLHVGEILNLDSLKSMIQSYHIEDIDAVSYKVADDAFATIDESNNLSAKMQGITYLMADTSIGTAVVKLSITDGKDPWNDFSLGLGKSFDDLELLFGRHYAIRNDVEMKYFLDDDPYIDSLEFFLHGNTTDSIVIAFHEEVKENLILEYLNQKFVLVDTLSHWYTNNANYLLATFSARFSQVGHKLVYTGFDPNWDDRIDDFELTKDELLAKYGSPFDIRSTTLRYRVKNDFAGEISYKLEPKVESYTITVNINISNESIKAYLEKKYTYVEWKQNFKYLRNIQIDGQEMVICVSPSSSKDAHTLYYTLEKNHSISK